MSENKRRTSGGSQVNPSRATDEHLWKVARKRTLSAPPPRCMQAVPANEHGITAVHPNRGDALIPPEDLKKVFEGSVAAVAGEVAEEVAKPERTFGPEGDEHLRETYTKYGSTTALHKINLLTLLLGGQEWNFHSHGNEVSNEMKVGFLEQEYLQQEGIIARISY